MKDVLIAKPLLNVPHVKWILLKRGMGNGEWEIEKCEIEGSVQLSDSVVGQWLVNGQWRNKVELLFSFFFKHLPFEI